MAITITTVAAVAGMQTIADHMEVREADNSPGDVAQNEAEKSAATAASGAITSSFSQHPAWPSETPTDLMPRTKRAAEARTMASAEARPSEHAEARPAECWQKGIYISFYHSLCHTALVVTFVCSRASHPHNITPPSHHTLLSSGRKIMSAVDSHILILSHPLVLSNPRKCTFSHR